MDKTETISSVGSPCRIAVFVSGGGTNLQALLDAQQSGILHSGRIVLVVSSNPKAFALQRAADAGVPGVVLEKAAFSGQPAWEEAILKLLEEQQIDLIVLAGFMSILSADFVAHYPERILNVHPSLIPAFCGKGYYGLRVHKEVLAYGAKITGATVHFVNEIPDGGRILMQKAVEILPGDTPEILQRRVMEQAEWILLPQATEQVCASILSK
jgi:phosphoribosylglycinamide formyltransferase-1